MYTAVSIIKLAFAIANLLTMNALPATSCALSGGGASLLVEFNPQPQESLKPTWNAPMTPAQIESRRLSTAATGSLQSGDLVAAKQNFLKLEAIDELPGYAERFLAKIYFKEGDLWNTYVQLDRIFHIPPTSVSSDETDPRYLALYGELCMKYDKNDKAAWAYWKACNSLGKQMGIPLLKRLYLSVDQELPIYRLRSYAYSACALFAMGSPVELPYAKRAVSLAPGSALPRLVAAILLKRHGLEDESLAQAWESQYLADEPWATDILAFRKQNGLFYDTVAYTQRRDGTSKFVGTVYRPNATATSWPNLKFDLVFPED